MQERVDAAGAACGVSATSARLGGAVGWLLSPMVMAVVAFAVSFAAVMWHYFERDGIGRSWQYSYAPAVFLACTDIFGMPPASVAGAPAAEWAVALDNFLNQRSQSFDCSVLPADMEVGWFASSSGHELSTLSLQASQWGHLFLTGLLWKLTGVSWWSVAYIGAAYAGTAFALLMLIFCRFAWPPLALALAFVPFLDSQMFHLAERLRDFGKIPPIYAAVLLLLMVASASAKNSLIRCVLLLGLVLGIGITLRSEMVLYAAGILVLAAVILIARRRVAPLSTSLPAFAACAGAALAFYMAAGVAYPEKPEYMSHALVLGMEDQRLKEAHLDVRSFSVMPIFSDQSVYRDAQLIQSTISSDPVSYQTNEYGKRTDIAFGRMIADAPYYGLVRIAGAAYDFFAGPWGLSPNTTAAQWMRIAMCLSALTALVALWRRNAALGFAVAGVIAMGAAITSLDYEWRHVRHMRWLVFPLTIAGLAVICHGVLGLFRNKSLSRLLGRLNRVPAGPSSPLLLWLTIGGLAVYAISVAGAALAQSHSANMLRAELMNLETEPIRIERTQAPDGSEIVRFPGQQTPFLLRLDFDLAGCGKHRVNFTYRYRGKEDPDLGKGTLVRMLRRDNGQEHYFFTVHDDIFTAFDGIVMDADDAACLVAAYSAGPPDEPFLYHMLIDGRWRPLGSFRF